VPDNWRFVGGDIDLRGVADDLVVRAVHSHKGAFAQRLSQFIQSGGQVRGLNLDFHF
jgi:hypothetical protein